MLTVEYNILKMLESIRTEGLNRFFEAVTLLGEETLLVILFAVLYFSLNKDLARKVFFIIIASLGVNNIIKNFVQRPRPFARGITCIRPDTATGYAFPSGHTQNFATWSHAFIFHFKKYKWLFLSVLLTGLVAFSRLYLGVHYPGDVVAGACLGIILSFALNYLYEKVGNKQVLYVGLLLTLTPFFIWFMFKANPLFEDFYKIYGMLFGFVLANFLEEKCVRLDNGVPLWKKLIRIVVAVLLAYVMKSGLKAVLLTSCLQVTFLFEALRYGTMVFVVLGICPLLFKKCHL